jgi:hypothetical protein
MPRTKKKVEIEIPETITGNSNLDKKLLTLPDQSNREAIDTAFLLQQLVRGQNSMLENQDKFGDEIRKLRERMDKYDQAAAKFEANKEQFITETIEKSETLKKTGDAKDRAVAKGTLMFEEQIRNQRANIVTDQLQFEDMLSRSPKVTVVSPGKMETLIIGGRNQPTIVPEEVRIKHKRWILPPGKPVEVPEVVAQVINQRRRLEAETDARSGALQKNMNNDELIRTFKDIDKQYGIKHTEE